MTDNEIIKALECCASGKNCEECSLNCKAPTSKDVFDLINRQQAEIDKLAEEYSELITEKDELFDIAEKQKAEIERLNEDKSFLKDEFERFRIRALPIAKSEAIKECIEKLKDLSYESDLYDRNERWVQAVTIDEINETYKEMVGEQG